MVNIRFIKIVLESCITKDELQPHGFSILLKRKPAQPPTKKARLLTNRAPL
jgi:hypothetical protein